MIIMTYTEGLSITYNQTKLSLHDAAGRHPPLDVRTIKMMVRRNQDSVNETTNSGQNVLHIALKVKNVPETIIKYLGNIIHIGAYQEIGTKGLMPLHLACLQQNDNIVEYVLKKCIAATTVHNRNGNYPSIWPVIEKNVSQQLLCMPLG